MTWPSRPIQPKYSPPSRLTLPPGPTRFGTQSIGTMQRHAIIPVKRGSPEPKCCARMADRMPSAPMTRSASAVLPSAKRATAVSLTVSAPMQLAPSVQRRVADRPAQQVMQIGAMRGHIGRAVFFPRDRLQRLAEAQPPFVPGDRHDAERLERVAHELVFEPERAQHLNAVRTDLQPGADLFEFLRALIERNLDAALAQRDSRGQAADAGADDDGLERAIGGVERHYRLSRPAIALSEGRLSQWRPSLRGANGSGPKWPAR